MLTASGLIVRFLKVYEESGYQSVKWVRYLTKASSSYQVRVCCLLNPKVGILTHFTKSFDSCLLFYKFHVESRNYLSEE
jgi:hypothetical protein